MNWLMWIIIGGAIALFLILKRLALVAPAKVRECLKTGAKVIDVRSEAEFQEGHLPGAINIPLDQLCNRISRHAPYKHQAILLYCLSGGRSASGRAALKKMGYRHCFNLGSLGRARKILEAAAEGPNRS